MTNKEKFIETFGFEPETHACVFKGNCSQCKALSYDHYCDISDWWNDDFKGSVATPTDTEVLTKKVDGLIYVLSQLGVIGKHTTDRLMNLGGGINDNK